MSAQEPIDQLFEILRTPHTQRERVNVLKVFIEEVKAIGAREEIQRAGVLCGEDAKAVLDSLKHVASPEEIARRHEALKVDRLNALENALEKSTRKLDAQFHEHFANLMKRIEMLEAIQKETPPPAWALKVEKLSDQVRAIREERENFLKNAFTPYELAFQELRSKVQSLTRMVEESKDTEEVSDLVERIEALESVMQKIQVATQELRF